MAHVKNLNLPRDFEVEGVIRQYTRFVKPSFERSLEPFLRRNRFSKPWTLKPYGSRG